MTLADLLPEMLTKGELSQVVAPKLVETTSVKQFWACRVLLLADHSPEGNISYDDDDDGVRNQTRQSSL